MTFLEAKFEKELEEKQLRERAEANRQDTKIAAKRWATAAIADMFYNKDDLADGSPMHVALFIIDKIQHHPDAEDSAEMHETMHDSFLSQLNIKPSTVINSKEKEIRQSVACLACADQVSAH